MKELRIGELVPKYPIIQGGMGVGISMSGLASAVANEGCVGVIAAQGIGMLEPDSYSNFCGANIRGLRNEIRKAKKLTNGIIGVNIMVAITNYAETVMATIEEKADIIFSGAGLPINLPKFLEGTKSKTKLVPIVSSGRAAAIILKKWTGLYNYVPDAIVVEGPLAGGHLGFKPEQIDDPAYALENLIRDVIKEAGLFEKKYKKSIPVIAAGGIYTGGDMHKFLQLGAAGVQMATRFVTTYECDADIEFKEAYINCRREDIVIIKSPVGMPGRAIRNDFIDDINRGEKKPYKCPYHCITTCDYKNSPYCIAIALTSAKKGNMKHGFAFAGANAYRAKELISVKELVRTILNEYRYASQRLSCAEVN